MRKELPLCYMYTAGNTRTIWLIYITNTRMLLKYGHRLIASERSKEARMYFFVKSIYTRRVKYKLFPWGNSTYVFRKISSCALDA